MDAGFMRWLGESRGFQPGDKIMTREQYNALYQLYLNETTGDGSREDGAGMNVKQIMKQAQAGQQPEGESAIGSWISSWFGGNDPGKPVAPAGPDAMQVATGGGQRRSASAMLEAALQSPAPAGAVERPQLPTGGRVAFEEAMPMPGYANAPAAAAPQPTPTPTPTPMPQEQFIGETFTTDQFRQMTGRDLAPGEYFDAKGRPFLVK